MKIWVKYDKKYSFIFVYYSSTVEGMISQKFFIWQSINDDT